MMNLFLQKMFNVIALGNKVICHSERSEGIARSYNIMRLLRRFTSRNDTKKHPEIFQDAFYNF